MGNTMQGIQRLARKRIHLFIMGGKSLHFMRTEISKLNLFIYIGWVDEHCDSLDSLDSLVTP